MQVGCSVNRDVAGEQMEVETQIRGIDGVTIVKSVPESKRALTPGNEYIVFELKFEVLGAKNRIQYRDETLFPSLRRTPGINIVDWTPIHRTNVRGTVRTVREDKILKESQSGFGGTIPVRRTPTDPMNTPRASLEDVIKDWGHGVQIYDMPVNTTDMRYHVMMPVKEIEQFMSRIYRADKIVFDQRYQQFIRDGATLPVYLAVGQNGRLKITGGEDLVWFAKRAGLEELPVFLSYQKQV
jgi:hypothetical protein